MKRLIAFLCAGSLCISLAACGSKKDEAAQKETEGKYQDLIEMLEDEDYEDAMAYIRDLAGKEVPETTDIYEYLDGLGEPPNTEDAQKSPLLPYLYGTWLMGGARAHSDMTVIVGPGTDTKYKNYTFREDGTCAFDDKELSWTATSCTETTLQVTIYEGETACYHADLSKENEEYRLHLWENYQGDGNNLSYAMEVGTLFNPAYYQVVTVTQDNWQDYFEFTHADEFGYNSFDEANSLAISYRFSLKPEYFQRISDVTCVEGALELKYTAESYDITVDYANQSYTIGEISENQYIWSVGGTGGNPTYTLGMDGDNNAYYGCCYTSGSVYDNVLSCYPKDIEIVRLQVTLYLTK